MKKHDNIEPEDKQISVSQEAKLVDRISESSSDSGKDEQERQTKVIVSIEQNEKTTTMEQFYKILNLVFKFDLRDNPNGGTYRLLVVGYLKLIQEDRTPLTEGGHIDARRLSRSFPINVFLGKLLFSGFLCRLT